MAPLEGPEAKQTAGGPEGAAAGPRGPYAAVDLGTNNCRLLVAKPSAKGFRVVEAYSRICRLGEGLEASGRLSEAAMARTLEALDACAERMRRRRVARARAVATAACRAADNCDGFVARVRARTGLELEIISSEEEARLALTGCAPLLSRARRRALVFDIGGGSTEVTWIALDPSPGGPAAGGAALDGLEILASVSLPLGVVGFAERFGGHRIKTETYRAMVAEVRAAFAPFEAAHGLGAAVAAGEVQMLGTSGTVTTLAGVHRGLKRYDRRRIDGCRLTLEEVRGTVRRIRAMGYEERVGHPCIGEHRADLVVAGCAILEALCTLWPVDGLRVADRGLREGILYHLMNGAAVAGWAGRQGPGRQE
ncbi:MAG: Ppx/GppA family phosphatase [Kiloniellales bacterium]|nr:Ppx/GppA family phosphatase [Kiloniellales bacterium]